MPWILFEIQFVFQCPSWEETEALCTVQTEDQLHGIQVPVWFGL